MICERSLREKERKKVKKMNGRGFMAAASRKAHLGSKTIYITRTSMTQMVTHRSLYLQNKGLQTVRKEGPTPLF